MIALDKHRSYKAVCALRKCSKQATLLPTIGSWRKGAMERDVSLRVVMRCIGQASGRQLGVFGPCKPFKQS